MGYPEIDNRTPFAFQPLFLADEEGQPLLSPLVKATYDLTGSGLALSGTQAPVLLEGELYRKPGESSYRYEPEGAAFVKLATDVVLVGSAVAPKANTRELIVAFQVGPLKKGIRVVGERVFVEGVSGIGMTAPAPFEKLPLQWERAFGGWDRSHKEERRHTVEPRNRVGVGHRGGGAKFEEKIACPNLEDPLRPFQGWGDAPPPVGFGFVSPDWEPRASYGGTYDAAWEKERAPLLAADFDRRFFNAAPKDQIAPGYLRGDERVAIGGVAKEGALSAQLPGLSPPNVRVEHKRRADQLVSLQLDTVIVDTDERKLFLIWRGCMAIREPTAVETIAVSAGETGWQGLEKSKE